MKFSLGIRNYSPAAELHRQLLGQVVPATDDVSQCPGVVRPLTLSLSHTRRLSLGTEDDTPTPPQVVVGNATACVKDRAAVEAVSLEGVEAGRPGESFDHVWPGSAGSSAVPRQYSMKT